MNLSVISPDMPLSTTLEDTVRDHLADLDNLYGHITGYKVVIRKTDNPVKKQYEIEARVLAAKSSFFCREHADSFELALDEAIANLARQLRRQRKERAEIW
jgi:ribosomal subunit interface protein